MFVRFRSGRARLQVSIVEPHRVSGKVRSEHVAGLGAIAQLASVIDRVEFWQSLYQRLEKLVEPDNRPHADPGCGSRTHPTTDAR